MISGSFSFTSSSNCFATCSFATSSSVLLTPSGNEYSGLSTTILISVANWIFSSASTFNSALSSSTSLAGSVPLRVKSANSAVVTLVIFTPKLSVLSSVLSSPACATNFSTELNCDTNSTPGLSVSKPLALTLTNFLANDSSSVRAAVYCPLSFAWTLNDSPPTTISSSALAMGSSVTIPVIVTLETLRLIRTSCVEEAVAPSSSVTVTVKLTVVSSVMSGEVKVASALLRPLLVNSKLASWLQLYDAMLPSLSDAVALNVNASCSRASSTVAKLTVGFLLVTVGVVEEPPSSPPPPQPAKSNAPVSIPTRSFVLNKSIIIPHI